MQAFAGASYGRLWHTPDQARRFADESGIEALRTFGRAVDLAGMALFDPQLTLAWATAAAKKLRSHPGPCAALCRGPSASAAEGEPAAFVETWGVKYDKAGVAI